MMRVLVTGGAGFVGSHVVDQLVRAGHEVRVADSLHPGAHRETPGYLNRDAEYCWGTLADPDFARSAVTGIDAVSHQAAMVGLGRGLTDLRDFVAANDVATAELLGALCEARFAGSFVLASSMVVYGEGRYRCDTHGLIRVGHRAPEAIAAGDFDHACPCCGESLAPEAVPEDATTEPQSVYAATKLHQEHLVSAFGRERAIPTIALRYHNVYGPRMPRDTPYAGVASLFRSAIERGEAPLVFEDGRQLRDFVHVDDVARANVLALERWHCASHGGHRGAQIALNVASGTPVTVLEVADSLCRGAHTRLRPVVVGGARAGDVRHVFASTERARIELGFVSATEPTRGIEGFATAPLRAAVA